MSDNRFSRRSYLAMLGAGATLAASAPAAPAPAGDADRARRMRWWHEAKFGMLSTGACIACWAGTSGRWRRRASRFPNTSNWPNASRPSRTPRALGRNSPGRSGRSTW